MTNKSYERLMNKIDKTEDCWEWTGTIGVYGYGKIYIDGKHKRAHRAVYEALVGDIPKELVLDHLCRNRACVNPKHLEAVTPRENLLRGDTLAARNKAKTHCSKGHEFTVENTCYNSAKNMSRSCRACSVISSRAYVKSKVSA